MSLGMGIVRMEVRRRRMTFGMEMKRRMRLEIGIKVGMILGVWMMTGVRLGMTVRMIMGLG